MTGFNLPHGCSVHDLPGNSEEEGRAEAIEQAFWDDQKNCTKETWDKFEKTGLDSDLMDIVWKAIEYGRDLGWQECKNDREYAEAEQKEYDQYHKVPKLRAYFRVLRAYRRDFKQIFPDPTGSLEQLLLDEELRKCLKSE